MKRKALACLVASILTVSLAGCSGNGNETSKETESVVTAVADENGNYVVNGSFEETDFTGWNITNVEDVTEELDIYDRETDCYEGVQSLHFYSGSSDINFTAEQTISGLEAGNYKLTGYMQGDTAGDEDASIYFYAIVNDETYTADVSLAGYVNWQTAEIDELTVEDGGEITVGVSVTIAPGGWGTIDNITLVKE